MIKVSKIDGVEITTKSKYQYDRGQMLELDFDLPEDCYVEFSNQGDASCVSSAPITDGVVAIPNACFEAGTNVICHVVRDENNSRSTLFKIIIPINKRPKRGLST